MARKPRTKGKPEPEPQSEPESKTVHVLLVFARRRVANPPFNVFYVARRNGDEFEFDDEEDSVRAYDRTSKVMRHTCLANPVVGAVYEVEASADNTHSIIPASARYVGRVDTNSPQVVKWAALDAAAKGELDAAAALKRAERDDPLARRLQPVRDAYFACSGPQRAQMLARVVWLITRGTPPA